MQGVERAIQHSQDNLYKAIPAKGEHKNFILVTIECGFFMAEIIKTNNFEVPWRLQLWHLCGSFLAQNVQRLTLELMLCQLAF